MKVEKKSGEAQKTNARLLILEARFYAEMCDELAAGAIALAHHTGKYDGYVALGCVLRGETTHYDIVANESARGIMNLTLAGLWIGNGILTCENEAQAWARARVAEMDKGGGAAEAALAMIRLSRRMAPRRSAVAARGKARRT